MNINSTTKDLILENVRDFNIKDVLECGQCFHFTKLGDNDYELIAKGKYLHIEQTSDETLRLYDTDINCFNEVWNSYFDFDTDYSDIKKSIISADERLEEAVEKNKGIRILNQDFFETLISFIISQNKQIPHIKQIVHKISECYGDKLTLCDGRVVSLFPSVKRLHEVSEDELRRCKVGFRAPYIKCAVEMVYSKEITEEKLKSLTADGARKELMKIKGVGEKVANCVMLFSLGFRESFPVDVWMKRIMEYMYFNKDMKNQEIENFAMERFGQYAGYAQQYLFAYGRENGIGK